MGDLEPSGEESKPEGFKHICAFFLRDILVTVSVRPLQRKRPQMQKALTSNLNQYIIRISNDFLYRVK